MSSRDNRARVHVEIPVETKQALKEADGSMWEVIDEGARMLLGLDEGSTEAALENRIEDVRQERTEIKDQLESLDQRLTELQEMEADLVDQLESIREKKETHRERLDAILDEMEDDPQSRPVVAWMADLREASTHEYGSESKENIRRVIEDLRNRAAEEMYAISPHRLTRTASAQGQKANADGGDDSDLRVLSDGGETEEPDTDESSESDDGSPSEGDLVTDGGVDMGDTDESGVHGYCHDCDWYATPDDHEYADVMTDAEAHTTFEYGHMTTVGSSDEVVQKARNRVEESEKIVTDGGQSVGDTDRCENCPRCGGRLSESPAADASAECGYCGFYEYEHAEVDLPPLWREEPQLADRLGLSRLFSHLDGPGFIGVRGDTVELVRADLKAGEEADPEEYNIVGRDERAEKIRELAGKYNDEYCGNGRSIDTGTDHLEADQ